MLLVILWIQKEKIKIGTHVMIDDNTDYFRPKFQKVESAKNEILLSVFPIFDILVFLVY